MVVRTIVRGQVLWSALSDRLRDDEGATAVEYALMLGLIFMAVVMAVTYLGQATKGPFEDVHF